MNKFSVFPCIVQSNDAGYNGHVVSLVYNIDSSLVLFFPIQEEVATTINFLLNPEKKPDNLDLQTLNVYTTMIKSWNSSGRYLSGILMDTQFDETLKEEMICVNLYLSSEESGEIEGVFEVSFTQGIIIAALEDMNILLSNDLINKIVPKEKNPFLDDDDDDEKNNGDFALEDDTEIIEMTKKIMDNAIKNSSKKGKKQ